MSVAYAIDLLRGSLLQIIIIAGPIMAIGIGIGLIIAIFQATTSLQDQTLTFVPKIVAIIAALFLLAPWSASVFIRYVTTLFQEISTVVR